jgi:hypothetical protein
VPANNFIEKDNAPERAKEWDKLGHREGCAAACLHHQFEIQQIGDRLEIKNLNIISSLQYATHF